MCVCVCNVKPLPPRELFECTFIDKIDDGLGRTALVLDVAEPALELEWMAQYLLLVREVRLVLGVGTNWSEGHSHARVRVIVGGFGHSNAGTARKMSLQRRGLCLLLSLASYPSVSPVSLHGLCRKNRVRDEQNNSSACANIFAKKNVFHIILFLTE